MDMDISVGSGDVLTASRNFDKLGASQERTADATDRLIQETKKLAAARQAAAARGADIPAVARTPRTPRTPAAAREASYLGGPNQRLLRIDEDRRRALRMDDQVRRAAVLKDLDLAEKRARLSAEGQGLPELLAQGLGAGHDLVSLNPQRMLSGAASAAKLYQRIRGGAGGGDLAGGIRALPSGIPSAALAGGVPDAALTAGAGEAAAGLTALAGPALVVAAGFAIGAAAAATFVRTLNDATPRIRDFGNDMGFSGGTAREVARLQAFGIPAGAGNDLREHLASNPMAAGVALQLGVQPRGPIALSADQDNARLMLDIVKGLRTELQRTKNDSEIIRKLRILRSEGLYDELHVSERVFQAQQREAEIRGRLMSPDMVQGARDYQAELELSKKHDKDLEAGFTGPFSQDAAAVMRGVNTIKEGLSRVAVDHPDAIRAIGWDLLPPEVALPLQGLQRLGGLMPNTADPDDGPLQPGFYGASGGNTSGGAAPDGRVTELLAGILRAVQNLGQSYVPTGRAGAADRFRGGNYAQDPVNAANAIENTARALWGG